MREKKVIYQVFTRTFGNTNTTRKPLGTLEENGVGKMNDFTSRVLKQIHNMGVTHLWFTGIIRHATATDYSKYGIPSQHAEVVKGIAGSPYAITDYYDIDPDIAVDVDNRFVEFKALMDRTHKAGLKVIIDFVPNHVAREYKSIAKPAGVRDLGEDDDRQKHFDPQNNFYYCPATSLDLSNILPANKCSYTEYPAKCTGNDHFDAKPGKNDWYETIKLNYGVDYCDLGGRSEHFNPIPSTWLKMTDILLFWAGQGVDGFRCDMAEMVPSAFWRYATGKLKEKYPEIFFVGEVYNPSLYREYISAGFDYLYDKVGMYDCLRNIVANDGWASDITKQWQAVDDIKDQMLYFLENHDEQRIASDFFAGNARKAIPALLVIALLEKNPVMIYSGQEFGERGMDVEGFSGKDGRSTIFDYWCTEAIRKGFFAKKELSKADKALSIIYNKVLSLCNKEIAVREGLMFDLMYANQDKPSFDTHKGYAFIRKAADEALLIVSNFAEEDKEYEVTIPDHAFDYLGLPEGNVLMADLLSGKEDSYYLSRGDKLKIKVGGYNGVVYKFKIK